MTKRLVSFRKLKISSSLVFLKRFLKSSGILRMVELALCLIIHDFCHFLNINLLIIGFRLVYGIFVLDMFVRSAFLQLSFPCIPMWLGIQLRKMLLFLERVFILSKSLVKYFCSVKLGRLIWSLNG